MSNMHGDWTDEAIVDEIVTILDDRRDIDTSTQARRILEFVVEALNDRYYNCWLDEQNRCPTCPEDDAGEDEPVVHH